MKNFNISIKIKQENINVCLAKYRFDKSREFHGIGRDDRLLVALQDVRVDGQVPETVSVDHNGQVKGFNL